MKFADDEGIIHRRRIHTSNDAPQKVSQHKQTKQTTRRAAVNAPCKQTQGVRPVLFHCLPTVYDGGPTLKQHRLGSCSVRVSESPPGMA